MAPHAVRPLTFDVPDPKDQVAALDLTFDLVAMKAMKSGKASYAPPKAEAHATEHGAEHGATSGSEGAAPQGEAPDAHPAAEHGDTGHAEGTGALDSDAGGEANAPLSNRQVPPLRATLPGGEHHATGEG